MMSKKSPQLRFEGFTDDWEERKLGDVGDTFTGLTGKTKEDFGHGSAKFVTYVNVFQNPIATLDQLDAVEIDEKQNQVQKGDVFFTTSSETPEEVGMSSVWTYDTKNVYLNSFTFGYRPRVSFDLNYMASMLRSPSIRKKITFLAQGISRYNISKTKMLEIEIPAPNLSEQKKIGSFFKLLDDTIALHQRKLDLLKEQKKGYLQKMFPKNGAKVPELRFAGFADDWEQRKLGDISYKVKEKNKTGEFTETLTNSAEYGIINQRDFFDKDISNAKNLTGYYVVKNDDFVYNPRISNFAPVGPIKRNKLGRTGVMSPLYYVFRTHDIDKNYFEKYFDTVYWHRFMELNGDSGARADRFAIKDSVFVEMPIPYPTMDEQQKIGSFFKQLDDTIALHQCKLDLLKEQKKAFYKRCLFRAYNYIITPNKSH